MKGNLPDRRKRSRFFVISQCLVLVLALWQAPFLHTHDQGGDHAHESGFLHGHFKAVPSSGVSFQPPDPNDDARRLDWFHGVKDSEGKPPLALPASAVVVTPRLQVSVASVITPRAHDPPGFAHRIPRAPPA